MAFIRSIIIVFKMVIAFQCCSNSGIPSYMSCGPFDYSHSSQIHTKTAHFSHQRVMYVKPDPNKQLAI